MINKQLILVQVRLPRSLVMNLDHLAVERTLSRPKLLEQILQAAVVEAGIEVKVKQD